MDITMIKQRPQGRFAKELRRPHIKQITLFKVDYDTKCKKYIIYR